MPVPKKKAIAAALEKLQGRIARQEMGPGRAFAPREDGHETAKLLKILEERGEILQIPGFGWVDTRPALHHYREYIGETRPTENLRKAYEANQQNLKKIEEDGAVTLDEFGNVKRNPQVGGGDPDWDNYGSPGSDYVNYPTKETKIEYDHHNEPYISKTKKKPKTPKQKRKIDYEEGNRG
jgi:hypothetical protein